VALESTIISHGMPYPQNVETAIRVENAVRENGAVPATFAIIKGKIKAGLTREELDYIGKNGTTVSKVSRRDIAAVVAGGKDGASTVAATMIFAAMAGIKVFATGGIGGVHRGAEKTMDISADLEELSVTPVMVVCSGAKSILDLGLTLEYLETKGVPVIGYSTKELPAFYTRESGFEIDCRVDTPKEIADIWRVKTELGISGGMLVVNPIPAEYSMDNSYITKSIGSAVERAKEKGIRGKDVTPFLLEEIKNITGGNSLKANIELVLNNARLASRIACEM
jgi:pseudouridylate synthase